MSFCASIEVALCVDKFYTIGLKKPGVYCLTFSISYSSPTNGEVFLPVTKLCEAMPYSILNENKFSLNSPSIDCESGLYRTKQFVLKGEVL